MICVAKFKNKQEALKLFSIYEHTYPEINITVIAHYHSGGKPIQDVYVDVSYISILKSLEWLFDIVDDGIDIILVYGALINFVHPEEEFEI